MAYVRKKKVGDYAYYQIVENRRVDGAPRQRVLLHLGEYPSVEDALVGLSQDIQGAIDAAKEARENYTARGTPGRSRSYEEKEEARFLRRAQRLRKRLDHLEDLVERGVVERSARAREEQHGEEW